MPKKIAIVTLSFNAKDITDQLIELLQNQTIIDKFDIIVVDNGSTDGTYEHLKEKYPQIILIQTKKNYGCSGGNCIGAMYAYEQGYEFIVYVDNDAYPRSENLIEELVKNCEKDVVTIPELIDNESIIKKKEEFVVITPSFHYLCVSKETIKKIGFPFFHYFLYFDDIEYGLKMIKNSIRIKKLNTVYYQHDKIQLKISDERQLVFMSVARSAFMYRNQFYYYQRNYSYILYLVHCYCATISFIALLSYGLRSYGFAGITGLKDYILGNSQNETYLKIKNTYDVETVDKIAYDFFKKSENKPAIGIDLTPKLAQTLGIHNFVQTFFSFKDLREFIPAIKLLIKSNAVCTTLHSPKTLCLSLLAKTAYFKSIDSHDKKNLYIFKYRNNFRILRFICLSTIMSLLFVPLLITFSIKYFTLRKVQNIESYQNYVEKMHGKR